MFDVLSIGMLTADLVVKPVKGMPKIGTLVPIDSAVLSNGGCALNTTVDLAKLGVKTAIIGKIGDDGCGKFILDLLDSLGVNREGVIIDPSSQTSATAVLVDGGGERTFLHCYGANALFTQEDIDYALMERAKIINIGGTMLMPGFDGEPCAKFLKQAKDSGKTTILDTAWDASGRWMEILRPCMQYIDYFMPSYDEAVQLSGKDNPEAICDLFLSLGIKNAIIKLGEKGCFIKTCDGEMYSIPVLKNVTVQDTTGAGDAFVAGFIAGICEGWSILQCGKFANAVGAYCVMAAGASNGIRPMKIIIEAMLND